MLAVANGNKAIKYCIKLANINCNLNSISALALKCHDCNNFDTALCLKIENSKNKLLKQCSRNETRCALLIEKSIPNYLRQLVVAGQ